MLNFIIITMLISVIYNYLFRRKVTNLNCGIFAFVGISSDKFSPVLFNILGVYNDNRGGDSCGVYFNKGTILGIKTEAKYEALVKSKKLHTTIKLGKYPVAIGHCRKASVGAVSEKNIQPVTVRDESKDNKLLYVHSHNGTITNHKDLAKKYNIQVALDESDSVTMSKLIKKVGFDVLGEYEGSAALVMYFTDEPNVLYAFHGQSKQYTYVTEERPLHYLTIAGKGTYISSEAAPLEFIGNGEKATSFKYNMVYKLVGDEVIEFKKVERENAVLKKSTVSSHSSARNEEYCSEYWRGYYEGDRKGNKQIILPSHLKKGITQNICNSTLESRINQYSVNSRVRYHKGFFMIGDYLANGEIICDSFGFIRDKSFKSTANIYYLYFFYGILIVNKESYDLVNREAVAIGIVSSATLFINIKWNIMIDILKDNALFPFTKANIYNSNCGYMTPTVFFPNDKSNKNGHYYTGSFKPIFFDYELEFDNGDFDDYNSVNGIYLISDFIEEYGWFVDYMDFGLSEEESKANKKKRQDVENKAKEDKLKEETKKKSESPCIKCGDISCEFQGCDDTPFEANDVCGNFIDKDDKDSVLPTLLHTIISEVTPVIADLDQISSDIETSGFKDLVADKLELITEANNKLKQISK